MKRIFFFCIIVLLPCINCYSQVTYGGMQQLTLNYTQSGVNPGFLMVNGVRFSRFFTGIGIDIQFRNRNNYYNYSANYFNTAAIFLDGRYYINKQKNLFCKLNVGGNIITQDTPDDQRVRYDKKAGYYGAAGIGFKARIGKEIFYSFDLSYCMRQTRYDQNYLPYQTDTWFIEKVDLRRNSIMLTMGIEIL